VTVMATLITLVVNSMAAFALSKYEFRGRSLAMLLILATLMVPLSVVMVPLYSIISTLGLFNSLWGRHPADGGDADRRLHPAPVHAHHPDELIDAARMDKASEWQIYWRIILPLTRRRLPCSRSSRSSGAGTTSSGR